MSSTSTLADFCGDLPLDFSGVSAIKVLFEALNLAANLLARPLLVLSMGIKIIMIKKKKKKKKKKLGTYIITADFSTKYAVK